MSSGRAFQILGASKAKTITKLFDRFMNRRVVLWYDKEITTTLTVPGTIRKKVMEQYTKENLYEETCRQVWLS